MQYITQYKIYYIFVQSVVKFICLLQVGAIFCNIHMMMLLVSQIFRNISYNIHISAVAYMQQQIYMNNYCSSSSNNTMNLASQ